jgi:hypothetical protein
MEGLAVNAHRQSATQFVHNGLVERKKEDGKTFAGFTACTFHDGGSFATSGNGIDRETTVGRVSHFFKDCGLKFGPISGICHNAL